MIFLCRRCAKVGVVLLLAAVLGTSSTAPAFSTSGSSRLTTVEWESYNEREHEGPGTYAFGYDIQDPETGNIQFREESRDAAGTVRGSYGVVEPDGNVRVVHYIADHRGFRVQIENTLKPDEIFPSPSRYISNQRRALLLQQRPIVVAAYPHYKSY